MALIIFDYDGVLADTLDDLIRFGQQACDQLGVRHVVTQNDLSDLAVMSFPTFGRACEVPEPLVGQFVEICLRLFEEQRSPPALFAGLGEVVRHLSTGHMLAVVTTNTSKNVDAFLAYHGLAGLVHAVYGVGTPGSKAQKISLARERLLTDPQAPVFMVGDSLSDMLAAREASVTGVAVTWGHQRLENLLRGHPGHIAHTPHDLIAIVEG